jgi:hypothetical protein
MGVKRGIAAQALSDVLRGVGGLRAVINVVDGLGDHLRTIVDLAAIVVEDELDVVDVQIQNLAGGVLGGNHMGRLGLRVAVECLI